MLLVLDNFGKDARAVIAASAQLAGRLQHRHVDTLHLFAGLLAAPDSVAGRALLSFGLTSTLLEARLEALVDDTGPLEEGVGMFTPAARAALVAAAADAVVLTGGPAGTATLTRSLLAGDTARIGELLGTFTSPEAVAGMLDTLSPPGQAVSAEVERWLATQDPR